MKFTRRSIARRKHLERQKQAIVLLGGKIAATHSTSEVPMRHAAPKPPRDTLVRFAHLDRAERARIGYELRHPKEVECETVN
jgi:hypothetical protein